MRRLTILFTLIFFSFTARAGWFDDDLEQQNDRDINFIDNAGFENGDASWTESGSSVLSTVTSGPNLILGSSTGSWDASAGGEFLTSEAKVVPNKFGGPKVCDVFFIYNGGDANIKAQIFDGSAVLAERVLSAVTEATEHSFSFTCTPGISVSFRLASTADAAIIYLDGVFVGRGSRTMFATPKVFTSNQQSVGTVGSVANSKRLLADSDFGTPSEAAYFHFNGDLSNSGQATATLPGGTGSPTFVAKGFQGFENYIRFISNDFDATGGGDSLSSSDAHFDETSSFTTGIWFKRPDWNVASQTILSKWDDDSGGERSWYFATATSGFIIRGSSDGNTQDMNLDFDAFFEPNSWHHFVFQHDGTGVKFYLDGQLAAEDTSVTLFNTTEAFRINGQGTNVSDLVKQRGDGEAQDFFYYDGVMTDAEINAIYSLRFSNHQQVEAGHILTTDSFSLSDLTDKVYFWNLDTLSDGSGNGKTLTAIGGATPGNSDGIFGTSSEATRLNGTSEAFSRAGADFDTSKPFSLGGWFSVDDFANQGHLIGKHGASPDQAARIQVDGNGNFNWQVDDDGTGVIVNTQIDPSTFGIYNGKWFHIALTWDGAKARGYVDGNVVFTESIETVFDPSVDFTIGVRADLSQWHGGRVDEAFFAQFALSEQDVKKLASSKYDHNKNVNPFDQQWEASFFSEDGHELSDFNHDWILDKRQNEFWLDFGLSNPGSQFQLVLKNRGLNGDTIFGDDPFDTGFFSTPPAVPVFYAHGMAAEPIVFVLQHEGHIDPGFITTLPASYFCQWSSTQIKCDLSSLTIDGTHRVRIIASSSLAGLALLGDPAFENGIVTKDLMTKDTIVPVGQTMYFGNIDIPSGVTLTVNGTLFASSITGAGTLTGTGTVRTLDLGNDPTHDIVAKDLHLSGNLHVEGTIFGGSPVKIAGGLTVDGDPLDVGNLYAQGKVMVLDGETHNGVVVNIDDTGSDVQAVRDEVTWLRPFRVKDVNGVEVWFLEFSINAGSDTTVTEADEYTITGVDFPGTDRISHGVSCTQRRPSGGGTRECEAHIDGATDLIKTEYTGTTNHERTSVQGTARLESKPTWVP